MSWFDDVIHAEQLTIRRVTSGKPDANGRATETVVEHVLDGYSVAPAGSQESVGDEKVITTRWRVSGPPTEVVREHDTVMWRGRSFEVDGEPQTFGAVLPHTEFFLQSVRR